MFRTDQHLYPYQQKAAGAMLDSNVLLAHEMGLGKTATTLYVIEKMRETTPGVGTIVVPASLKFQWAREVEKFTDQRPVVIDGTPTTRDALYESLALPGVGYMITTYDLFVRDYGKHMGLANFFLVADEATALKNFKSKRSRFFKSVQDAYKIRFALTGTPIENGKADEMFSIFAWLDPNLLGPWWHFEKRYIKRNHYGWIEGYKNLDEFHNRIKPYVERATFKQPEVAKYLPKVQHMAPLLINMDAHLKRAVAWITDDILSDLDSLAAASMSQPSRPTDEDHPDGRLMAKIQVLRMLLDHPDSVRLSAAKHGDTNGADGSAYAKAIVDDGLLKYVHATPKMDATVAYINDFLEMAPDNKVVVFSSFVFPALKLHGQWGRQEAVIFTGSMNARERDHAKQRFMSDPECRVFVSTDAGGYGLDLPQANLLVNFDLPWQAGMLKQRNARIRRASSKWGHVTIQDVVVADTLEERMLKMLSHKTAVAGAIVDGEGITDDGEVASTLDSLRSFLTDQVESRYSNA